MSNAPVFVLNQTQKRDVGSKAQLSNISAAKAVSDIVKTTLGPQSMLKMLIDPLGGIVLTNDGNAILRELDVSHPAAKSMLELSRTQDETVGDGTTSVIILTGELLQTLASLLQTASLNSHHLGSSFHPVQIVHSLQRSLHTILTASEELAMKVESVEEMKDAVENCLNTKHTSFDDNLRRRFVEFAVDACLMVRDENLGQINLKRFCRVEKIPGGRIEDVEFIVGSVLNKDVTHAGMSRERDEPRVLLLDCPLEYKKMESTTNFEISDTNQFDDLLKQEEKYIMDICASIIAVKPDLVCTEKGVSDLAQHFLQKAGISVLRRLRKTDNTRLARCLGVKIANDVSTLTEENVSKKGVCTKFQVKKIGDEYFSYIRCKDKKEARGQGLISKDELRGGAVTIVLRGGSKDVLNEMERDLWDCLSVARNVVKEGKVVTGGGCFEMQVSRLLRSTGEVLEGKMADALEVIPRTLLGNCGADVVKGMTKLRGLHGEGEFGTGLKWGVDGVTGDIVESKVVEPLAVKVQMLKTAFESAGMILRVDDIISGVSKGKK
eukprot:snap_masked-scaffold_23-processed-gene-2.12-mRNA-1 protein AED:0.01 eAED:0.01 QI:0/-1/0/1/-1/1/1/0/549